MSSSADGKRAKRKEKSFFWGNKGKFRNPRRGAPGILLTCDTGREVKCRREGFQILEYYWNRLSSATKAQAKGKEPQKQSFEEELAALKKEKSVESESPFVVFETGCRGTVFILKKEAFNERETKLSEEEDAPSNKKQRLDKEVDAKEKSGGETAEAGSRDDVNSWNPLEMVDVIFQDCAQQVTTDANANTIPGSRFVTRIIPMQKTCSADADELKSSVQALLEVLIESLPIPADDVPTFAIQQKRRICGHLKSKDVIDAIADQVGKTTREKYGKVWKVDLGKPDYTIWVELCKSIGGVSIIPSRSLKIAPKFNIAELRENQVERTKNELLS